MYEMKRQKYWMMVEELVRIQKEIPLKLYSSTKEWYVDFQQLIQDKSAVDKAIFGGFCCKQFSFAFLAGYQAALDYGLCL